MPEQDPMLATPEVAVNINNVIVIPLEGGGIGAISRAARMEAHPDNEMLADQAEAGLTAGAFHESTDATDLTRCGDGRGARINNGGLQVFGGTAGLVKTDIYSGAIQLDRPVAEIIASEVSARTEVGKKSGAHRADTHGKEGVCGCGECDGAHAAIENYVANETALKPLVTGLWSALGLDQRHDVFSEELYADVFSNVQHIAASRALEGGPAQVAAVEQAAGDENCVEDLEGGHKEAFWVINLIEGTKFNQAAFLEQFDRFSEDGKGIQAFWEDQWAIENEIIARHEGDNRAQQKALVADLVRRVATAANLTAADLKVVILK